MIISKITSSKLLTANGYSLVKGIDEESSLVEFTFNLNISVFHLPLVAQYFTLFRATLACSCCLFCYTVWFPGDLMYNAAMLSKGVRKKIEKALMIIIPESKAFFHFNNEHVRALIMAYCLGSRSLLIHHVTQKFP